MTTTFWKTEHLRFDGLRLSVDIAGQGPPLLLIHGIPGWRGTWHAAGRLLTHRHQVIVPDLAGFGESDPPREPWHAAEHAARLWTLLDRLGVQAVDVAGFDFGGPIAVAMLRLGASRINTLTLVAANALTDTPIPAPLQIARVPCLGEAAFRLMLGRFGLTMMWRQAVRRRDAFPLSRFREALRFQTGLKSTRRIFVQSLRHLDRLYRPIEDTLPSIACPSRVIWGDADPFFPVEVGQRIAAAIPSSEFVVLDNCGHFVPEECPDRVAAAILKLTARDGQL